MGRFSCFYGHVHSHRDKKTAQRSFETIVKMLQPGSQIRASEETMHKVSMVESDANSVDSDMEHLQSSERGWKSVAFKCEYDAESNTGSVHFEMGTLRRSLSEGYELDEKARMMGDDNTDDYIDQGFSYEESHDCTDRAELSIPYVPKSLGNTLPDEDQEAGNDDQVNDDLVFPVCDPRCWEKEGKEDSHVPLYAECGDGFVGQTPGQSRLSKSYSMPNFGSSPTSPRLSPHALGSCSRSLEDEDVLGINKEDVSADYVDGVETTSVNKDDSSGQYDKFDVENAVLDNYDSFEYGCSSKEWIVPVPHEMTIIKTGHGSSSSKNWADFPNQDFKIKRIDDWVSDLQRCSPVHETNDLDDLDNTVYRDSAIFKSISKVENKTNPGMEAAKKYISSLNATATTAHLANHGLVAIPLLSAFVSLKILNMSGNSIVRLTAGALPRGLHMLNLSKNKLSAIEGLRELTRLRVLDVSYNKISRIGHGLASCSSLKELYLAGNKISEVEGLHRLLKLSVLDLRFNKIATSKSLGQLAANYNSLQAISLEGNPAQKNVGDEQLKKSLQSLLPHLAYYNRQHIKSSTLKDSSDKSVRLGISARQFDRGARCDQKSSSRRGRHGSSVAKRSSHSSSHGQKGQPSDLAKHSRGRHGVVPQSSRMTHHHQHFDLGNRPESLKVGLSLHKSRSESTLAAV